MTGVMCAATVTGWRGEGEVTCVATEVMCAATVTGWRGSLSESMRAEADGKAKGKGRSLSDSMRAEADGKAKGKGRSLSDSMKEETALWKQMGLITCETKEEKKVQSGEK